MRRLRVRGELMPTRVAKARWEGSDPQLMVDLFNARLADEGDLRMLRRRPRGRALKKTRGVRSPLTARRAVPAPAKAPGRRKNRAGVENLLLVLGESPEDRRVIAYVGGLLGRRRGFRLHMTYVLPELPSGLLEHGGAEDPETEERFSAALQAQRIGWIAAQRGAAQSLIDRATASLRKAGLPSRALKAGFCGPVNEGAIAAEILEVARAKRCHTVVVARHQRSWLDRLLKGDLRSELARRASHLAIWGIG
jgi:nucleotide-binding universal stress UspA family protein